MADSGRDEVVKLASIIFEAKQTDIPGHLIKIKSILQRHAETSKDQLDIKEVILEYDLLSWCAVVLRFDFEKMDDGFAIAVNIIDVLCECCTSVSLQQYDELRQTTLPGSVHSALLIAWQVSEQYHENVKQYGAVKYGSHAEKRATLKTQFKAILDSIIKLVTSQSYIAPSVLKSDNLIRLLIEDGIEMEKMQIHILNVLLRCIKVNPTCLEAIPSASLNHLLDELIFKITTSQNDDLVGLTVKLLNVMVDAHPDLAGKMTMRFKGLKALMTKWLGHGFDRNLKILMEILDAGNAKIAELARRTRAVKVIWAAYQGWKTRTRVAKLHKVVPSLQSSFRRKRQEKLQVALKEQLGVQKKYESELQRKRALRSAREKQLRALEIVPANKVGKHIQMEEQCAAVKIQSVWRGSSQRKKYEKDKSMQKRIAAAVVIQRSVRRFLKGRMKMETTLAKSLTIYSNIPTEEREDYQMRIEQGKAVRGDQNVSITEASKIHNQTQQRLLTYHTKRAEKMRFSDPRLEALLVKLRTEQEVLSNLPNLSDATKVDVDNLSSGSNAVALAAEMEHSKTMKEFSSQWWQKLSLKTDGNLDPFDDKIKNIYDEDMQDIEEFLKKSNEENMFG